MTRVEMTLQVKEISGQNPFLCMQCGLCSAGCTGRGIMDMLPRQVMRLIQFGNAQVLDNRSIWMCTTCLTCTARCPRGIDIARVMEALRTINLRRGDGVLAPEDLAAEFLAEIPQMALTSAFRKLSA
ncbi:4Fe-4S dicluster domain-containing protein [Candidatus Desulforudis audaxviator]|nr:4Fe-4S dicluster domain-containing protein [Candidatus Desulforudis audaxviator]